MASLSPRQLAARRRIEALIRIAEPGLNLLLAAGDRLSRTVERDEVDPEEPLPAGSPAPAPGRAAGRTAAAPALRGGTLPPGPGG